MLLRVKHATMIICADPGGTVILLTSIRDCQNEHCPIVLTQGSRRD